MRKATYKDFVSFLMNRHTCLPIFLTKMTGRSHFPGSVYYHLDADKLEQLARKVWLQERIKTYRRCFRYKKGDTEGRKNCAMYLDWCHAADVRFCLSAPKKR